MDQFKYINSIFHDNTCPRLLQDEDFDDQSVTTAEMYTVNREFDDSYQDLDDIEDCYFFNCQQDRVHRIQIDESKLVHPTVKIPTGKLNRKKLLTQSDPIVWKNAEWKQLESHSHLGALLKPCKLPRGANVMTF